MKNIYQNFLEDKEKLISRVVPDFKAPKIKFPKVTASIPKSSTADINDNKPIKLPYNPNTERKITKLPYKPNTERKITKFPGRPKDDFLDGFTYYDDDFEISKSPKITKYSSTMSPGQKALNTLNTADEFLKGFTSSAQEEEEEKKHLSLFEKPKDERIVTAVNYLKNTTGNTAKPGMQKTTSQNKSEPKNTPKKEQKSDATLWEEYWEESQNTDQSTITRIINAPIKGVAEGGAWLHNLFDYDSGIDDQGVKNRMHNESIDLSYYDKATGGYINDQGVKGAPINDIKYGSGVMQDNGCGIIAIHNALVALDDKEDVRNLAMNFEGYGQIFDAAWGTNHYAIEKYFRAKKYDVKMIDEGFFLNHPKYSVPDADAYILTYWNSDSVTKGLHTVAIRKFVGDTYIMHNVGNGTLLGKDVNDLIKKTGSRAVSLICISK